MKIKVSAETKQKWSWIGKKLFIGMVVALLGSMLLEMGIYTLGHKVADAYVGEFVNLR